MARYHPSVIVFALTLLFPGLASSNDVPMIRDAVFSEGFEHILSGDAALLHDGGAKIIESVKTPSAKAA